MALGNREPNQEQFRVLTRTLPRSPGRLFCRKLDDLLDETVFDQWIQKSCRELYADECGRQGIPPGLCFRARSVSHFEGISSRPGIAGRRSDRPSLRSLLGLAQDQELPKHSGLTRARKRIPLKAHVKAGNTVDVDSDLLNSTDVYHVNTYTMKVNVVHARPNLLDAGPDASIEDLLADKGCHATENLRICERIGLRTYVPELKRKPRRRRQRKPTGSRETVYANRRRVARARGKRLQRLRSELTERSFANMCETGDCRRSWLRGLENVSKRYLVQAAARNLGVILRSLFAMGTPRGLQRGVDPVSGQILAALRLCAATTRAIATKRSRATDYAESCRLYARGLDVVMIGRMSRLSRSC